MYYYYKYSFPIGIITLASDENSIVGLWLENQKYYMDALSGKQCLEEETAVIRLAKGWLERYFGGESPSADELPVTFIGSDFRKQVWSILREIPYGSVMTYGDIARRMASDKNVEKMSAQAVGGAVGHNPVSIIIPCHRVVGASGSLTGYAGGIDIKIKLLDLENADMSELFVPKKGTAL